MAFDAEIEQLRAAVGCAVLLERHGYKLDQQESTRASLKYRRGEGETIIVNHDGKGWWDTGSAAKGDVFKLAQHLQPGLNFGQVRRELRNLVGMAPAYPSAQRPSKPKAGRLPPGLRWLGRSPVEDGSAAWTYLTQERGLPANVVRAASRADVLREGPYASAWFAHRSAAGELSGFEIRGPSYSGFSADGEKTLFRLQFGADPPTRLAVAEAPIDAMSLAALEGRRADTLYVSTTGGMGPGTIAAIEHALAGLAKRPGGVLVAGTDADKAGDRYAERLAELAAAAAVPIERARPAGHKDWNDVLRAGDRGLSRAARPSASKALAAVVRGMQRPPPETPPPWTPAPIPIAERIRALERHDALQVAAAMASRTTAEPGAETRPSSAPSLGASP